LGIAKHDADADELGMMNSDLDRLLVSD